MTAALSDFDHAITEFLSHFLGQCFPTTPVDAEQVTALCHAAQSAQNDQALMDVTDAFLNRVPPEDAVPLVTPLKQRMLMARQDLEAAGFVSFVKAKLQIKPMDTLESDHSGDFIYIKINHGFWEQLFAIFSEAHDPELMRIEKTAVHIRRYVTCAFLTPLAELIRQSAHHGPDGVDFGNIHFALSLHNGMHTHQDILHQFADQAASVRRVNAGAAIGIGGFFNCLFADNIVTAAEGSFPKLGYLSGHLNQILQNKLQSTDRVAFVVPPHLDGMRLSDTALPQECLLISGTHVHEAWLGSLIKTAHPLLKRLSTGENVLVITQSGVFSAILGLYLVQAKRALGITSARLHFFDLGQVTDLANPDGGGPWLKNHDIKRNGMFQIAREHSDLNAQALPN